MELHAEQLKTLQTLELEMFKEFTNICAKLDLKYYLLGGTLLGAIRHQGFIPWDDDIDVAMPRSDYDVFIEEAQKHLSPHLFLQTFTSDPDYPANFAKIRNSNTTFIESSVAKCHINHGVYIDVFPLDFYPSSAGEKIFKLKNSFLKLRINCALGINKGHLLRRLAKLVSILFIPSRTIALKKREALFKSVKDRTLLANHCGAWGKREIVPAEWYAEGCEVKFEGLTAVAPKEYDKWLTQVYGDYRQLPPKEKQIAHHYVDVLDLETPYTYYTEN